MQTSIKHDLFLGVSFCFLGLLVLMGAGCNEKKNDDAGQDAGQDAGDDTGESVVGFNAIFSEEDVSFEISHSQYESVSLSGLSPSIRVGDKSVSCADYEQHSFETLSDGAGWRLSCQGSEDAPDLFLYIEKVEQSDVLSLRAVASGAVEDLRGFEVVAAKSGLNLGDGDAAWLSNGYQSWSPSGAIRIADKPPANGLDKALKLRGQDDEKRDGLYLSSWYTAMSTDSGPSLVVGATTANLFKSSISVYREQAGDSGITIKIISGMRGESVSASKGEEIQSETFWLSLGDDAWTMLRSYAGNFSPSRTGTGSGAKGWNSWYDLYEKVTAQDIEANATIAAASLKGDEDFTIMIDDGWERDWGDWEPNDKFPDGMAAVATSIKAKGMIPGLWLAPLLADGDSQLAAEHPEWLVRDTPGGAFSTYSHPNGDQYILDVTNPEAAAFVSQQITKVVGWGFEVLKMDFLFAGAYEGVRSQDVTGTQAYEIALNLLRDAMGEDVYFLACGAPLFSAARPLQFDAVRTGADIAFGGINRAWSFVVTQLRSTSVRSFLHGLAFEVDADPPLVRATVGEANFTDDEAWSMVVSVLVSGGAFFASDDLTKLSEEEMALLQDEAVDRVRKLPNPTARPIGLLDTENLPTEKLLNAGADLVEVLMNGGKSSSVQPSAWYWSDGEGGAVAALFAFYPDGLSVNLPLESLGLDSSESWTVEVWGPGPQASIAGGSLTAELEAYQSTIVHISK